MLIHRSLSRALLVIVAVAVPILVMPTEVAAQEPPPARAASDERFQKLADRYWQILTRRPRKGTALDQWYRHWFDAGRIDELMRDVKAHASDRADDPASQVLLGLLLELRGIDDEAAAAYASAAALAEDDYYVCYLRGDLAARRGELAEATRHLAAAVKLDPPRIEALDINKKLGRLYLRQQRYDEALATWQNVAQQFPDDRQVLEELAELLTEEKQYTEAIARWEQLAELVRDHPPEQLRIELQVADLESRLGKSEAAVARLDQALDGLEPGSWQARDVRRRIEAAFLADGDAAGLVRYYAARQQQHPQELETMVALAAAQGRAGDQPASLKTYRRAVAAAPSRHDIREGLIDGLERAGQFTEALAEAETLATDDPRDVAILRRLGNLHLDAATAATRAESRQRAAEAFKRIAATAPDDPAAAVAAAEAARDAYESRLGVPLEGDFDEEASGGRPIEPVEDRNDPLLLAAEAMYREAIRRGPGVPQYHEYLGELLHSFGRRQEALTAWQAMTEGPGDTAANWRRLAETLANYSYLAEAASAADHALELDRANFALHEMLVRLRTQLADYDAAIAHVEELDRLADDPLLEERALARRVEVYTAAERLDREIESLGDVAARGEASRRHHWLLALMLAEKRRYPAAIGQLQQALAAGDDDVRLRRALAAVQEQAGDLVGAIAQHGRLAEMEPTSASHHLRRVAELQLALGRGDAARNTAESLIGRSPDNLLGYELLADVEFRTGQVNDAFEALRRALRVAPNDMQLRERVARALGEHGRTAEAIEHYWRCFECAESIDAKLQLVAAMARLAQDSDSFERLIQRLNRLQYQQQDPRGVTLAIVAAYREIGEYRGALEALEQLLSSRGDDVVALALAVQLSERLDAPRAALEYQRRITRLAPDRENLEKLARCYTAAGDEAGAAKIWQRIVEGLPDSSAVASIVDEALSKGGYDQARQLLDAALAGRPNDWRLRFRAGRLAMVERDHAAAAADFAAVLATPAEFVAAADGVETSSDEDATAAARAMTQSPRRVAVWVPEIDQLDFAREAHRHLGSLERASALYGQSGESSPGSPSLHAPRGGWTGVLPPRDPPDVEAARIESMLHLLQIARRENTDGAWFGEQRTAAGDDLTKLRRLGIVAIAAEQFIAAHELLDAIERLAPENPLPHVFRLLAFVDTKRVALLSQRERDLELAAVRASFDWLDGHQPDLRHELRREYWNDLVTLGALPEAAAAVGEEVDAAERIAELPELSELAARTGSTELQQRVFDRAIALAPSEGSAPVAAAAIQRILTNNFLFSSDEGYLHSVLALLDAYLHLTTPMRIDHKVAAPGITTPSWGAVAGAPARNPGEEFPVPTPYIDTDRLSVLLRVHRRLQAAGKVKLMLAHLDGRARQAADVEHVAYRLAAVYVNWLYGQRNEAIEALRAACEQFPEESALRLVLVLAHDARGAPIDALRALNGIQHGPIVMGHELAQLRRNLLERTLAADPDDALTALEVELSREAGPPDLHPYFDPPRSADSLARVLDRLLRGGDRDTLSGSAGATLPTAVVAATEPSDRPADVRSRVLVAGRVVLKPGQAAATGRPAPPRHAVSLIDLLLRYAHAEGKLSPVVEQAAAQTARHARHSQLLALLTLAEFARDDCDAAATAARAWAELITEAPGSIGRHEAWLVVNQCLRHTETRPIGRRLIELLLPLARDNGWDALEQMLVIEASRAAAEDGNLEEASRLVRRMVTALQVDPAITDEDGILRVERLAQVAGQVPDAVLPIVFDAITTLTARQATSLQDPDGIARPLHEALSTVAPRLDDAARRAVLDQLSGLLFGGDAARSPNQSPLVAAPAGSAWTQLASDAITLASSVGRLDELRRRVDTHPAADTVDLLPIRSEAAVVARDWQTALAHLTKLIELRPGTAEHYAARGGVHAELEQWSQAVDDYYRALDRGTRQTQVWIDYACAQLAAGDVDGYCRTCRDLLGPFGGDGAAAGVASLADLAPLVRWCTLTPGAGIDATILQAMVDRVVDDAKPSDDLLATYGAALYRVGDYDQALIEFNHALVGAADDATARHWLWLALVHHALGQGDEAGRMYDAAGAWQRDRATDESREPLSWKERLEINVLDREAVEHLGRGERPGS